MNRETVKKIQESERNAYIVMIDYESENNPYFYNDPHKASEWARNDIVYSRLRDAWYAIYELTKALNVETLPMI